MELALGADVKLPEPESDDYNVDAFDESGAVSERRPWSLEGNAAVIAAGSKAVMAVSEPGKYVLSINPVVLLLNLALQSCIFSLQRLYAFHDFAVGVLSIGVTSLSLLVTDGSRK